MPTTRRLSMVENRIHSAKPQDFDAVIALARSVAEAGDAFPWEPTVSDEELALYWLPEPRLRVETFVCDADGDGVAGVYVLYPAGSGRVAHTALGAFMVAPSFRGKGLAKQLCRHALQEAKERGYTSLRFNLVVATNTAAVRTCLSCGFKIVYTLPRAFKHPEQGFVDTHVMLHNLEDAVMMESERGRQSVRTTVSETKETPSGPLSGLSYPLATGLVGEELCIEAEFFGGRVTKAKSTTFSFSVEPALPNGLTLNAETGQVSGQPEAACDGQVYRVTAVASWSHDLPLRIDLEPILAQDVSITIDEAFAKRLESVTQVADLLPEPAKAKAYGDWMVWMVHRAWLDDPALTDFSANNMHMPLPHIEKRIAPKLMAAMAWNTHIEVLSLSNTNIQKTQGTELAAALRKNTTLRTLNLEANFLDSTAVRDIALAIKDNSKSSLEHLRLAHQKQMGQFFGRPTEEAVGQMMESNQTIVKLGFDCNDAHWRNLIDRTLVRNNDFYRRRQLAPTGNEEENLIVTEERTLGHLFLHAAPAETASKVFQEDGSSHNIFRSYIVQNRKLPTTSQLQSCAKNSGAPLPYHVAAPLVRECRARMLEAAVSTEVVVTDAFGTEVTGTLRSWNENNDNWFFCVTAEEGTKRYEFRSSREPAFSISAPWAEWAQARAQADRGGA